MTSTQPAPTIRKTTQRRRELILKLGGCCRSCGSVHQLQMDCICPMGPEHHRMSSKDRQRFYEAQHDAGNLQLLCRSCHVKKTFADIARRQWHDVHVTCPKCSHHFRPFPLT